MNKKFEKFKKDAKRQSLVFLAGATVAGTAAAIYIKKAYRPTDKIALWFPRGVIEEMKETGRGVVVHDKNDWFTIKYHPNK